jgi:serine/threonine protein kinase
MQYCPDGSLEDQIRAGVADARAILPPLCGAVKCVHAHGLIHRDIKPGNILISPMGQILLADFGLAVNDDLGRTSLTTSNWCSQGFAPPEQYRDMRSVTKRADIFAIGAIYYYIKTGRKIDVTSELSSQLSGLLGFDRYFLSRSLAFEEGERLGDVDHITGILDKGLEESGVFDFLNLGPQERLNALDQKMKAVTPVIDNMDAGERLLRWMQCILPLEPDACVLQSLRDRIKTLDDDWGEAFGTVFREGGNDV